MNYQYLISAHNFAILQESIAKINRRAVKLDLPPVEITVVETVKKEVYDKTLKFTYEEIYFGVNATGVWPKLNDWKFIAAIEPIGTSGLNLVKEVPGETCPEQFRDTDMTCEHCGTNRYRKSIYILHHENQGYKRVGRNCLKDFINTNNVESFLKGAEQWIDIGEELYKATNERYPQKDTEIPLYKFLSVTAAVIRYFGWVSASAAATDDKVPTSFWAWDISTNSCNNDELKILNDLNFEVTTADANLTEAAVQWLSQEESTNTYIHDLKMIAQAGIVTRKCYRYAASLFAAYNKHCEQLRLKERELNNAPSEFIGEIKGRYDFKDCVVTSMIPLNEGMYPKILAKFVDQNGNELIWFASEDSKCLNEMEVGNKISFKATVSKHSTFRDKKQTVIQRVTLLTQE